ncbi:hypothetical protein JCM10135_04740 [Stetteria hydrogenophila]
MRGASAEPCRRMDEVINLLEKLLAGIPLFFDKRLTLNSDGRRLLSRAARACEDERVKRRILACLRNPTLDEVAAIYESIAGRSPWSIIQGAIEAWGRRGSDGPRKHH